MHIMNVLFSLNRLIENTSQALSVILNNAFVV